MATIIVLGTLDTKGHELAFVADQIRLRGHHSMLLDTGTTGNPQVTPDIPASRIISAFANPDDRGSCVAEMASALPAFLVRLVRESNAAGVISLGGGGGTSIATSAMQALPLGFPKIMVTTMASGNTSHYLGISDIVMIPSIVDVAGINRVSRGVFARAAAAVCAMADVEAESEKQLPQPRQSPTIVASMFGNTTECVRIAREKLEATGYEVLVFHATGAGGRLMESLVDSGMVNGVLDITTTEIADEIAGGVLTAGKERLEAAGRAGIPSVVVPGCVDMVNFGTMDSVPSRFSDRHFYRHNDQVTLMRTNVIENIAIATFMADKLNAYSRPPVVILPEGGVSVISEPGGPFHDVKADTALFETLRSRLNPDIKVVVSPLAINHPEFAALCVRELLEQFTV